MEDKLIRLQIARTGSFGADNRTITAQDLQDVIDTFDGRCPISLGHYAARKDDWWPSWGNVENLTLEKTEDGNAVLIGDITIRDVLWDAIKNKFYPGWSVSIPTRPDGKHYLHHLAFLGAVPPAIRNLKIIATADGDGIAVDKDDEAFKETAGALYTYADFSDGPVELVKEEEKPEDEPEGGEPQPEPEPQPQPAPDPKPDPEPAPQPAANPAPRDGNEKPADGKESDFSDPGTSAKKKGSIEEKARKIYSSTVKSQLDAALEGRVPAGMKEKVHEFADLVLDEWDFSDDAEEPRILTLFKEIVAAIDRQPKPGRMDFSDINDRAAAKVDAQRLAKSF